MGLFDDVKCLYPLPWPEAIGGWFQSYDTPAQYCEKYEIRESGELWYRNVVRKFEENPSHPLGFQMAEQSSEWVREMVTGEIELHTYRTFEGAAYSYSVQFWFRDGLVKDMVCRKEPNHSSQQWPAWKEKL
jgi:hypothetical protein